MMYEAYIDAKTARIITNEREKEIFKKLKYEMDMVDAIVWSVRKGYRRVRE